MVLLVAFALVAAACDSTGDETTTTAAGATETTAGPEGGATTEATGARSVGGFTYRVGMTSDITSGSYWDYQGPGHTFYMGYVHGPTKPQMFAIQSPGIVVSPDVATGLPAPAVQEGDVWTVTQPLREDYVWSDGSPVTANDIVFTYETVRDAELGGNWVSYYPYTEASSPQLSSVEALDENTVRLTFSSQPGAVVWPHQVGVAPIMSEAAWGATVAEAMTTQDPAAVLYSTDGFEIGDLSGGPVTYNGREPGAFITNIKNENYSNAGTVHTFWEDGSYAANDELYYGEGGGDVVVEYTEGPFVDRTVFSIYGDQAAAMLALVDGEIDYWINPLGMSVGLRQQGFAADNLEVAVNPENGFRYLAFNMRESPGKYLGWRQAMAYFDKENLAQDVFQGVASPVYTLVPAGNTAWYNEEAAGAIAERYVGLGNVERLNKAYEALEADGFTWTVPPELDDAGNILEEAVGSGLIDPEGNPVVVEIMAPSATYDPLRHTASLWLEDWAERLGADAKANPMDFNTLVARIFGQGVGTPPDFDMYILGWSPLGNPAWLSFHEGMFHSRNFPEVNEGRNATAYSNPEFDTLADAMFSETDQQIAYDQVWRMEQIIADDLPYVVLYSTAIVEFYNADVDYPFTTNLSGIEYLKGMQGLVAK